MLVVAELLPDQLLSVILFVEELNDSSMSGERLRLREDGGRAY
jgi:hypothetical protein